MSMDFAIAMGLRPEQGIIAGAVACLVGRTFGRSKYQCGTDHTTRVNAGYFLFQRGLRLGRSLALPHDNQSDAGAATTSCCLAYYKSFSGVYPMPQSLYSHVLVPTNYEPGNQAAYRIAFAAAHSSKSVVSLLHVLPDQNLSDYRDLDAIHLLHRSADEKYGNWKKTAMEAAEEKARHLQRLRDEVHPELIGPIEVRRGDVADEIVKYANETGVDLIVTAGSRPGILPDFSRSLSDRLARATPVKILRVTPPKVAG
jgi:nucleotide-binding universal stress UspA family protein